MTQRSKVLGKLLKALGETQKAEAALEAYQQSVKQKLEALKLDVKEKRAAYKVLMNQYDGLTDDEPRATTNKRKGAAKGPKKPYNISPEA